jgi:hypothetical protein
VAALIDATTGYITSGTMSSAALATFWRPCEVTEWCALQLLLLMCIICVLCNEQVLRAEEAKYAQESGDDVHQHRQALKDLDAKLQSTEVINYTTASMIVSAAGFVMICITAYIA